MVIVPITVNESMKSSSSYLPRETMLNSDSFALSGLWSDHTILQGLPHLSQPQRNVVQHDSL